MGLLDSLFGSRQETGVDPETADYIRRYREQVERYGGGLGSRVNPYTDSQISSYMNPYEREVIEGIRGDFDYERGAALQAANDAALRGNAFGGNRHGALLGSALAGIGRAETSAVGDYRYRGYQDALGQLNADRAFGLNRDASILGAWGQGMTPISQYSEQSGNIFGQLAGVGLASAGLFGGLKPPAGNTPVNATPMRPLLGGAQIPSTLTPTLPNYAAQQQSGGAYPGVRYTSIYGY